MNKRGEGLFFPLGIGGRCGKKVRNIRRDGDAGGSQKKKPAPPSENKKECPKRETCHKFAKVEKAGVGANSVTGRGGRVTRCRKRRWRRGKAADWGKRVSGSIVFGQGKGSKLGKHPSDSKSGGRPHPEKANKKKNVPHPPRGPLMNGQGEPPEK